MPMLGTFSFRSVGGDGVEDVDEDEKESDQERHPPGNDVGGNHETDPGDDNKQACGEERELVSVFITLCLT